MIAPPICLSLGAKYYVALRKGETLNTMHVFADMSTCSMTPVETQMKADLEDVRLPDWAKQYPVIQVAPFQFENGFIEE